MSRYASPKTSCAVNPLDNELSAVIRYMTTTQLPSHGIEDQVTFLSTNKQFHVYKSGAWKPLFPLPREVLGDELQTVLNQSIQKIFDESGNYVGLDSDIQIITDEHLEVTADPFTNRFKIGIANVTRDKIDAEVISQIDNIVQGISVGPVTANKNITFRPEDPTEITLLANAETDTIYFGIQKIARAKLADDVVADLESALQSISTGGTFVTAPMVKFTSNEAEFKMQANQETNEVHFQIIQVPRSKIDPSVLQLVDLAIQRITANGETVQGNDIYLTSVDESVVIDPNPALNTIDFKVKNVNSTHFDPVTKDIMDHAFHTISVLDTNSVATFRGHDLTIAHDSEIDVIADTAQQKLYFTLLNVPRDKLDPLVVQKAESAVKNIRVNNGLSVAGEHLRLNTSAEFSTIVDPVSNTVDLGIQMIPKSKIDPTVTSKVDTALQTITLMNGNQVIGTNVRLDSNDWVHFEVEPSTNTLKVFGTNKVRVNSILPNLPDPDYEDGDIVMVTNTTPPTWYSLYQGAWTPVLPPWVQRNQSGVSLSAFGGNLDISRVSNYIQADFLETDPSSNGYIKNIPTWIETAQTNIQLELFGGDLSWDRIANKPDSFVAYKLKIATGSFPEPAEQGNVCFRTDIGKAYIFDGSTWGTIENTVATRVTTLDGSFPPNPIQGQVVFRIDQGVTYVYDGMEWDPLGEGFAWIRESQNEILLTDFGGNLAWSRIVPETIPAHFSAYKVRSGSTLPDPATVTKGEVWYRSDVNALYIHNGTEWVRQNEYVSWIKGSQGEVALSAFGGNLDYSRITNTPDLSVYTRTNQLVPFIQTNQTQFALENFASNLPWTRVSGRPVWVANDQVTVPLEQFGGDLDYNRLKNVPVPNWEQADSTQKNFIANKPTWIRSVQSNVSLDAFSGNLDYTRVSNKPTWLDTTQSNIQVESFGGTFPYSRISNRPLNLTDLVNNTNFLRTTNVLVDSTLQVTRDDDTHKVTLAVKDVPWNKLSGVPLHFSADSLQRGITLPSTDVSIGDVFYKTDSLEMYVHNGNSWVKMAAHVDWINATQSNVDLNAFGGVLPSSRITDQIRVSATTPITGLYDGLIWRNTTDKTILIYYQGSWFTTGTDWLRPLQSDVKVSGFQNDSGYVDPSGARAAVKAGVLVTDLSGSFPFSRVSELPSRLTDIFIGNKYLYTENVGSDSTITVTKDLSNSTVTLAVNTIDWNQVNNKPTTYMTQRVQTVPSLDDYVTSPPVGTLVYELSSKHLFVHTGTSWVQLEELKSWVKEQQTDVQVSSFGGTFPASRISGSVVAGSMAPANPFDGLLWWKDTEEAMYVHYEGIWFPIGSEWAVGAQSSVLLSQFNNDSGFVNALGARNAVIDLVDINDLKGNLPYSDIMGRPTQLTDLSNNTDFLQISRLSVDSTLQMSDDIVNKTVSLSVKDVPWAKLSGVPSLFTANQIRNGSSFPTNPVTGEVVYRTDEKKLYIYSGASTGWIANNNEISWLKNVQEDIALASFGGSLEKSRISDQVKVSVTEPSAPYVGMIWTNPNTKVTKLYTSVNSSDSIPLNQWVNIAAPWVNESQSSVDLAAFNNATTQYVNSAQAISAVKAQVLITDLSGNFPYARVSGRPSHLTDLSDNTGFLDPSAVTTTDALVSLVRGSKSLQINLANNIPWSRLDASSIPDYFDTDRVRTGPIRPTTNLDAGDVFYDTSENALYVHDGAMWKKAANHASWMRETQGEIPLSAWGGNISNERITGQLAIGENPPSASSTSTGMMWLNTTNDTAYVYNGSTWSPVVPSWAAKKTQGEVSLAQFDNSITRFVNDVQVLSSVRTNVKLQELQGTVPYSSLTEAPTAVSAFVNDSNFLSPAKIDVSGTQLKITKGAQSVVLELEDIPWSRVANKPSHFTADRVKVGSVLPQDTGELGEGFLFYHTVEDVLYYHNGNGWIQLGNKIDWLAANQSSVQLVNFGGSLPASRLSGTLVESSVVPTNPHPGMLWKNTVDGNLRVFNGTEFVQIEAKWIKSSQSSVNISEFANDASYASVPQVQTMISQITFDDVLGTLQYTDIQGRPTKLSDLSNDTTFLEIPRLNVGDSLVKDVSGTNVTLQVSRIPWNKVDNRPTTTSAAGFAADRVLTGTEPPAVGTAGDIFYDINDRQLYIHSGDLTNGWIQLGRYIPWLTDAQSGVSLASFGGQIQGYRIDDKIRVENTEPTQGKHAGLIWRNPVTNVVKVWDGTVWQLLYAPWVSESQGSVQVSGFANDAQYVKDSELKPNVLSKVSITDLSGTLMYSSLSGRPGSLSEFTNTPGYIKYTDIRKQDNDNTLTLITDHENRVVKLAVNVPSLVIPWLQVSGAPSFVTNDVYQKRYRTGGSIKPTTDVSIGDFYYDVSGQMLYIHDGNVWVPQSIPDTTIFALKSEIPSTETFLPYTRLRVGSGYPTTNVSIGDMFYDMTTKALSIYDGIAWVEKVPDLSSYITENELSAAMTTALPSMVSNFADKTDVSNTYVNNTNFTNTMLLYTKTTDLDANFVKLSNFNTIISQYTPTSVLTSNYSTTDATTAQINNSITNAIAPLIKEVDVDTTYLKISTFNNTISLYTPTSVLTQNYPTSNAVVAQINSSITSAIAPYVKTTDADATYLKVSAFNNEISMYTPTSVLIQNYPTSAAVTTQIQSALGGYITKTYADTTFATIPNVLAEMNLRFSEYTKTTAIQNTYVRLVDYRTDFNALQQDIVLRSQLMPVIQSNQSTLFLGSFGGSLDFTRIANLPSWLKFNSSEMDLNMFGGILDYSRIANAPTLTDVQSDWGQSNPNSSSFISNKPSWITPSQGSIDVSLFGGKVDFMRLSNVPSWIRTSQSSIDIAGFSGSIDYNQLSNKPSWMRPSQSQISLSGFKTDLRLSRTYVSSNPDVTQVGELTLNLEDNELYFHNGTQWKKASSVISTSSGLSGGTSSARMDIVPSILSTSGKVTGDLVFDNTTKSAYFHDGTKFVRFGDVRTVSSLQVDPTLVGSMVFNTSDQSLYFFKGNAWVEVQTGASSVSSTDIKIPLVASSTPTDGDLYFDTTTQYLKVYSNGSWYSHHVGNAPDWVKSTASEVPLSGFYNDLPKTIRVVPSITGLAGTLGDFVYIANQNATFVHNGSTWVRTNPAIPTWIKQDASQIPLSIFQNDLPNTQIPAWIQNVQDPKTLSLSMFTNDLSSTSEGGEFISSSMKIYFASNGSTSVHLRGTCSFDGSLEENLFTSYKIVLVNPARNKGVVLKTIPVGESFLDVIDRQGGYLNVPFYVHGDMVNPMIAVAVDDEVSFDGFSLYCITSKSVVLPTNYTSFTERILIGTETLTTTLIDLSGVLLDTYGKILSAVPKITMDGLVLNNVSMRYYERKSLSGFEKVIALSTDGVDWMVGSTIDHEDGSLLSIPFLHVGDSTMWCIGYRVAGRLFIAHDDYHNRITFIPNTVESRVFASTAYLSQQESLPLRTGLIMDETSIEHHETTGTMISFSAIKSWDNTPYYHSSVSGYKRLLKQDSIGGRLLGSMAYQNGVYTMDDSYHLYPALFSGFYDSIVTDPNDAYIYELKNDTNAPWVASNPMTVVAYFGHDRERLLFKLFKMTYAFIKYGYSTMTDRFMEMELYNWYLDNIVENIDTLLASGLLFYANDLNSISFHPSIFHRSNPFISSDALDILYYSFEQSE